MARSMNLREQRPPKTTAAPKKTPQLTAGEMALERLLQLAQWEVEHDPYRGMLSPDPSPWSQCLYVKEMDDPSSAARKVFATCHCTCPSLVLWTELQDAEKNKRRKRKRNKATAGNENILGHRPMDPDFQCACDYNPVGLLLLQFLGEGAPLTLLSTFFSFAWLRLAVSWMS